MILVSNSYNAELAETNINIEIVGRAFVTDKEKYIIGVIYRLPSNNMIYFNTMLDAINAICKLLLKIIM